MGTTLTVGQFLWVLVFLILTISTLFNWDGPGFKFFSESKGKKVGLSEPKYRTEFGFIGTNLRSWGLGYYKGPGDTQFRSFVTLAVMGPFYMHRKMHFDASIQG